MKPDWGERWPQLTESSGVLASPESLSYNCIAYAAGDESQWWEPYVIPPKEPGLYWPPGATPDNTVEAWSEALGTVGYLPCLDSQLEPDTEKAAIFTNAQGVPTHVAKQATDGRWLSKMGDLEDIQHSTLEALEGPFYGRATVFLRRSRPTSRDVTPFLH